MSKFIFPVIFIVPDILLQNSYDWKTMLIGTFHFIFYHPICVVSWGFPVADLFKMLHSIQLYNQFELPQDKNQKAKKVMFLHHSNFFCLSIGIP